MGGYNNRPGGRQQFRLKGNPRKRGEDNYVELDVPYKGQTQIPSKKLQVTDPGIGLRPDTVFEEPGRGENPGLKLAKFGGLSGVRGLAPSIQNNPYNFVEAPPSGPWREAATADHSQWASKHHNGYIGFIARALTPVFVPEGFPYSAEWFKEEKDRKSDDLRRVKRRFCRMPNPNDPDGKECYAIPGSSLKGVLRSMIEALANDRFGVSNKKDYEQPFVYRRRCYSKVGFVKGQRGEGDKTDYVVLEVEIIYCDGPVWDGELPESFEYSVTTDRNHRRIAVRGKEFTATKALVFKFEGNLLARETLNHHHTHVIARPTGRVVTLPHTARGVYEKLVTDHPHYKAHLEDWHATYKGLRGNEEGLVRDDLKEIRHKLIYYTVGKDGRIDSFGKNVNYLWPAMEGHGEPRTIAGMMEPFFEAPQSHEDALGMSDRMFGFAASHTDKSAPLAGKVRIETTWGPRVAEEREQRIDLAPLTGPATRGKSRPLYLAPGEGGLSASYSDANPELKGRKFFWHQRPPGNETVWEGHLKDDQLHVKSQLPPPIVALKAGETFQGRIQFENLTDQELGALLYALKGPNRSHALKVGKGKPRGLGSLQVTELGVHLWNPATDYASLVPECTARLQTPEETEHFVTKFKEWVVKRARGVSLFEGLGYIRDFNRLHAWPGQQRVCYYPVNFSNYGWLPDPNRNPDEAADKRPEAMKRARDL